MNALQVLNQLIDTHTVNTGRDLRGLIILQNVREYLTNPTKYSAEYSATKEAA